MCIEHEMKIKENMDSIALIRSMMSRNGGWLKFIHNFCLAFSRTLHTVIEELKHPTIILGSGLVLATLLDRNTVYTYCTLKNMEFL
jgi:hypothetical protein